MRATVASLGVLATALLVGCGGGAIEGTISGLTADGLVLSDGSETITVAKGKTKFSFPTELTDGAVYSVTVVTQPDGLRCTVSDGTGKIDSVSVPSTASVTCVPDFGISGTVSGLTGDGLVLNDGHDTLSVAAGARTFAFRTLLEVGASYEVVVDTPPAGQTCTVTNGSGVIADRAITEIELACR